MKKKIQTINNLLSNTHQQKWIPGNNGGSLSNFFSYTWNLNRTLLKNILRVVYPIYVILVEKDKDKGKDIDNLFYILS